MTSEKKILSVREKLSPLAPRSDLLQTWASMTDSCSEESLGRLLSHPVQKHGSSDSSLSVLPLSEATRQLLTRDSPPIQEVCNEVEAFLDGIAVDRTFLAAQPPSSPQFRSSLSSPEEALRKLDSDNLTSSAPSSSLSNDNPQLGPMLPASVVQVGSFRGSTVQSLADQFSQAAVAVAARPQVVTQRRNDLIQKVAETIARQRANSKDVAVSGAAKGELGARRLSGGSPQHAVVGSSSDCEAAVAEGLEEFSPVGAASAPVPRLNEEVVLTPELIASIPIDDNGQKTSIGSMSHSEGTCRPCAFHNNPKKVNGCENGLRCPFCHFSHPKKKKTSRLTKVQRAKARIEDPQFVIANGSQTPGPHSINITTGGDFTPSPLAAKWPPPATTTFHFEDKGPNSSTIVHSNSSYDDSAPDLLSMRTQSFQFPSYPLDEKNQQVGAHLFSRQYSGSLVVEMLSSAGSGSLND